ncbi:M23 family metallopeptidase [Corallococcus sp. AB030]|uniref:Peptidoglycan DD-metalloendopeptidase family protein n=3 Tax=Corallococcus exiguus TaxID=83462 RepID=A0A7X5BQS6_9BACT|nr:MULTISPECIES: M23 family metallopeptidase [Corallococcus]NBC40200.1 peptidoglycan DD-metalloendopeptidase family protein [Corallococcus exiguus]RKH26788.1 M23 family metallopeptidase [Corallococcus sp. CA041A]RKI19680.1 M23 family metallopeptidase [Corallococcus sp. AB030]RUO94624.1 M23 family metallopeptidase [Corallococcus sp. AB018]TNV55877.1 M23 family metallopeptidase [Corallococcus exiguus]
MRPNLPTLGGPPKRNPFGPVVAVSVILGAAAGGVWWWKQRMADVPMDVASQTASALDAGTVAAAPVAPPAPTDPVKAAGLERVSIRIEGPLETALVQASDSTVGPALAQVVTRTLVWWVRVPGEILRGDTLDVLFQRRPNEEPLVYAVRFVSGKTGQTHRAYRFTPAGEVNSRYYLPGGDELELRMEKSPIDSYEQITSLLRDGRGHKGVDFRAPVGTTVRAPFAGVIKRKNWNFGSNGNCIELVETGGKGRRALFLHLAELPRTVQPGMRVNAGQVLAQSGNTGHSFAPHLHYQLMLGENRVLDPFDQHKTFRASLAAAQKGAFDTEVQRLDGLLGTSVAGK